MPAIGITGGIATGKSTVTRLLHGALQGWLSVESFSADLEARRLTESDFAVIEEIRSAFGEAVFDSSRNLARDKLRALAFANPAARKTLEGILHPRIRDVWLSRARGSSLLLAEIPLLYETQAETHLQLTIVTACSRQSQLARLTTERGLAPALAAQMVDAQMPLEEKMRRADRVIWTDCPTAVTAAQLELLTRELIATYGGATVS